MSEQANQQAGRGAAPATAAVQRIPGSPLDDIHYEVEAYRGNEVLAERFDTYQPADGRACLLWAEGWRVVLQGVRRWTVYTMHEPRS